MRVLHAEERTRPVQVELGRVRGGVGRDVLLVSPVRAEERVPLHLHRIDGLPLQAKCALPRLGLASADRALPRGGDLLGILGGRSPQGPLPGEAVVVAVHEHRLHARAVQALAVGEHLAPDLSHAVQLGHLPGVGHVAGDHDGVHAPLAEILQRGAERTGGAGDVTVLRLAVVTNVNVAHHAEAERRTRRRHVGERPRVKRRPRGREAAACELKELSSCVHPFSPQRCQPRRSAKSM